MRPQRSRRLQLEKIRPFRNAGTVCPQDFFARFFISSLVSTVLLLGIAATSHAADRRPGFQPSVYALENVTAVRGAEETIEGATIVLRNGVIEAVGAQVAIPLDAERIDCAGLYAYAGFIDAYSTEGVDDDANRSRTGTGQRVDYGSFAWGATPPDNRSGLTPEFLVSDALTLDDTLASPRRGVGFTSALIAPSGGVSTGQSALVSLNGRPRREIIIESPVGLHVALRSTGNRGYPSTLMGYVSHLRQSMIDARHYEALWEHYREYGGQRPPIDPALATLRSAQKGETRVFWEANTRDQIHRALDLADEFGLTPVIVGGREAWRVANRLAAAKVPVVVRIDFPEEPKTGSGGRGRRGGLSSMTPEQLKERFKQPDLPDRFRARIEERLKELEEPQQETKKDERKLPESARLLADAKRRWVERIQGVGTLAEQRVAFCFSTVGHRKPSDFHAHLRACIERGLSSESALAALTTDAADIMGLSNRLGQLAQGYAAHVVVFDRPYEDAKAKLRYSFADLDRFEFNKPTDSAAETDHNKKDAEAKPQDAAQDEPNDESSADQQTAASAEEEAGESQQPETPAEPFLTEIEADRKPSFGTGGDVVIRGATVLTVTKGTIEHCTIVVRNGKITAVGPDVVAPSGVHVIEAGGLYVMPGMIDAHTHIAVSGGVNESSLAVVPEVRIKDAVTGDSLSIYRALAGGLTTARLLHGSSNPIGGQDAVVKLRWGQAGRELIVREGPRGVKFALGENPKRSTTRYPDTRLGVEAVIRRSFEEGRMYRRIWEIYAKARARGEQIPEPRRDLRLEALGDVVHGELLVHSHCYRADEILMLMRLAESYGIRIKSLQHVLEGYKVAAEIAAHGASNATFSDWWAYKVEAYDAIPHNTALLVQAGAEVTLKSDDSELMRHMNQEAAKTLRYGGLSEIQALETVTINAARQIGLDHRIGSIEVGKDADFAVFNGHPLNGFARCEMTLIDGEIYFERRNEHLATGHGLPIHDVRRATVEVPTTRSETYVLTNARIVPVSGPVIESGTIVVSGTQIEAVHAGSAVAQPADAAIVDLKGMSVFPGMINAGGSIGLTEVGSLRETQDYSERGRYNSDIRASIALNPDSEIIPVTRANGVLATLTRPSGGVISGQSVLMHLHGWIPPEMAIVDPAALHVNFPTGSYGEGSRAASALERVEALKQRFELAVRYHKLPDELARQPSTASNIDPELESLAPYALGEGLVIIHANNHGDILAAIEFANELKLNWLLSGARDAWKCVQALKRGDVGVILGPSMSLPRGTGVPYDVPYRTAALLQEAGVRIAMNAGGNASQARNLPFQAAMAVAHGLPAEEGLKAVTLYPARMLGVEDRLGSIEVGKLANLVICDGHMLQPATQVRGLFIAGKPLLPTSRHTRLYARYQQRLEEVSKGLAPLGVNSRPTDAVVRDAEENKDIAEESATTEDSSEGGQE